MEYSTLSIDIKKTGQNIHRILRERNISVKQLQTLYGFEAPNAIYRWLRGETLPTVDHLVILAHALDLPVDNLLVLRAEGGCPK